MPKKKKITYKKETHPDICDRFIQTMQDKKMTQQDMAQILQIPLSTIKQISTYRQQPTIGIIKRWAKKLNKSYKWIIDGK